MNVIQSYFENVRGWYREMNERWAFFQLSHNCPQVPEPFLFSPNFGRWEVLVGHLQQWFLESRWYLPCTGRARGSAFVKMLATGCWWKGDGGKKHTSSKLKVTHLIQEKVFRMKVKKIQQKRERNGKKLPIGGEIGESDSISRHFSNKANLRTLHPFSSRSFTLATAISFPIQPSKSKWNAPFKGEGEVLLPWRRQEKMCKSTTLGLNVDRLKSPLVD